MRFVCFAVSVRLSLSLLRRPSGVRPKRLSADRSRADDEHEYVYKTLWPKPERLRVRVPRGRQRFRAKTVSESAPRVTCVCILLCRRPDPDVTRVDDFSRRQRAKQDYLTSFPNAVRERDAFKRSRGEKIILRFGTFGRTVLRVWSFVCEHFSASDDVYVQNRRHIRFRRGRFSNAIRTMFDAQTNETNV